MQAGHVPVIVTSGQQARRYEELGAYLVNVDAPKLVEPLVRSRHCTTSCRGVMIDADLPFRRA